MDFSKYPAHRKNVERDYGEYYKKYPYALLLIDFLIQLRSHQKHIENSWVKQKDMLAYFDLVTKSGWITWAYSTYIKYASYVIKPNKSDFLIHVSFTDEKFPGLTKVLSNVAIKNDLKIIEQAFSLADILSVFKLSKISPYRCFIGSKSKKLFSRFRTYDVNAGLDLLEDNIFMTELDDSVKEDVLSTSKLIKRLGIKVFINTGDTSGNARVLIESSKLTDFRVLSIAHGYVNDVTLIGALPVYSDRLILWTKKQLKEISEVVEPEMAQKLVYVGFPKNISSTEFLSAHEESLVLMGPIQQILQDSNKRLVFKDVLAQLKRNSCRVKLRLHPLERFGIPNIKEFISEVDVELSQGALADDIALASFIIGANSSTLVEAASTGRRVYMIEDLLESGFDFEGTITIKANTVETVLNCNDDEGVADNGYLNFNKGALEDNLSDLLKTLK